MIYAPRFHLDHSELLYFSLKSSIRNSPIIHSPLLSGNFLAPLLMAPWAGFLDELMRFPFQSFKASSCPPSVLPLILLTICLPLLTICSLPLFSQRTPPSLFSLSPSIFSLGISRKHGLVTILIAIWPAPSL